MFFLISYVFFVILRFRN